MKLLDDVLDASERQRLTEMLRHDPNARETYLDYMSFHSYLRAQQRAIAGGVFAAGVGFEIPGVADDPSPRSRLTMVRPFMRLPGTTLHGTAAISPRAGRWRIWWQR